MGERLGGVFAGHVSGVTEWGLYVEMDENHCEGMVPMRELDDDFYEFDEKNFLVRGRRTHHTYQLGEAVTVQVARADLIKKQLDLVLVTDKSPAFSHRIDKQPITEQNSGVMAKLSRDERKREQYEGATASRRSRQGKRGNSTRREVQKRSKAADGAKAGKKRRGRR